MSARSVLPLLLLLAALAPSAGAAAPRPIETLADAERAFSAMAVARGMKPAFLHWLAEDAVIFRPGPVNGAQSWQSRPAPPGVLEWAPEFVELSGAGDAGFSTGPWEYRESANAKVEDQGHFISVWRRTATGEWRVALDCGGSHPAGGAGPREATLTEGPAHAAPDSNAWRGRGFDVGVGTGGSWIGTGSGGLGVGLGVHDFGVRSRVDYEFRRTAREKNAMMVADRALGFHARKSGWERAYREVSAGDLRFQRRGQAPLLGADAAAEACAARSRDVEWQYRGNGIAKSWDLGWVWGLAIERAKGASRPDTSSFAHLWRKDDAGKWKLVIDWEGPFAKQ